MENGSLRIRAESWGFRRGFVPTCLAGKLRETRGRGFGILFAIGWQCSESMIAALQILRAVQN